jgi:hypothetical protein
MRINSLYFIFSIIGGFSALLYLAQLEASRSPVPATNSSIRAVVVELFTSEGCSSCPPADALLKKLGEQASVPGVEIIPLEEHVDYWDHLGWKDAFSSSAFTERQNDYAGKFGNSGVYTPQMVVDGQTEFVGIRSREAKEVILRASAAPKLIINLVQRPSSESGKAAFDIRITGFSALPVGKEAELWIAITEKDLYTDVKAGENSGERLQHAPVVRSLHKLDTFRGSADFSAHSSLKLESNWQRTNLTFVAFAVERGSRKIIGAAAAPVSKPNVM